MQQHAILDIEDFAATSIFGGIFIHQKIFKDFPFSLYIVRIHCFHHIDLLLLKVITSLAENKNALFSQNAKNGYSGFCISPPRMYPNIWRNTARTALKQTPKIR